MAALTFDDIFEDKKSGALTFDDVVASQPSYLERVGGDIAQAGAKTADIVRNIPNMNPAAAGVQILGQGASIVSAPIAQGAVSAFQALPQGAQDVIKESAGYVADKARGAYQSGINALAETQLGKTIGDYGAASPNLQANLQEIADTGKAAANIAMTLGAAKATKEAAQTIGKGTAGLAEQYAARYPEALKAAEPLKPLNADLVRNVSRTAFEAVEKSGTGLSPQLTAKMVKRLQQYKPQAIGGRVLTSEDKAIFDAIGEFDALAGQPLTIKDFHRMDQALGNKATLAYVAGDANKARIISNAQDDLRETLMKATERDFIGTREGADILMKEAIPTWSVQAKMETLQKIIDVSQTTPNPATAIKTGFRTIMRNDKKFKQYPKDVQKMIVKAASTGKVDDALSIVGSRLNPIIQGASGGNMAIGMATSAAGRFGRNVLAERRASKIINEIAEPVRPVVEKYRVAAEFDPQNLKTLKEIGQMPPEQAKIYLDKYLKERKKGK